MVTVHVRESGGENMFDDWTTQPAPGEGAMPPAPVIKRADPSSAGCWVDGVRGIYAPVAMVDHAIAYGYVLNEQDAEILEWARKGLGVENDDQAHMPAVWDEIQTEAEQWFNDNVAPNGHSFGWLDGDFMMASEVDWCVWYGERCDDPDHVHVA